MVKKATQVKGKGGSKSAPAPAPRNERQLPAQRPSTAVSSINYGDLGPNAGMEGADRDSFAIPFLTILQKMSPQLDRNAPEYIEDGEEGDILNTATQEVYDGKEGILVMPVDFKRSFTAWVIREKGGGFKGEYTPADPIVLTTKLDEKNRNILPDGQTQLVDTRLHGVILLKGDTPMPALINMASTQIKKSKRWMTGMQELQQADNLPTFAHVYRLTTIPERNDKGSWMGWQIERIDAAKEQEHVDAAVAFYKALKLGSMKMRADPNAMGGHEE